MTKSDAGGTDVRKNIETARKEKAKRTESDPAGSDTDTRMEILRQRKLT